MFTFVFTLVGMSSCKKKGCIDPLAYNYSKEADLDDGSCEYFDFEIFENITTPTTLEAKTYKIRNDIYVSSALILSPGTKIIMCEGSSITIESNGHLNATGSLENPIIIRGELAIKGFWAGIAFKSNNLNNKLIHCQVNGGGTYSGWEYASIYIDNDAQLNIQNTIISNSYSYGLFVANGGFLSEFSSNILRQNTTGLSIAANQVTNLDSVSNYNDFNTNNYIEVRSDTITSAGKWRVTNTPFLLEFICISTGLEICPGVNLLMKANGGIKVETGGFLNSVGTIDKPISIKGQNTIPGYWNGISVASVNPNNKMAYNNIEDGGSNPEYQYSNIFITGKLDVVNSMIRNANNYGIFVNDNGQISTNGTLQLTAGPVEAINTFSGNGAGPSANCTNSCTIHFN